MKYKKTEIINNLFSENVAAVTNNLLDITFNCPDYEWVQDMCILLIEKSYNYDVKGLAITCLGHIARIHKSINKEKVIPFLKSLESDSKLSGRISDALDDIQQFT